MKGKSVHKHFSSIVIISFCQFAILPVKAQEVNRSMADSIHTITEVVVMGEGQKKIEVRKLNVPLIYLPMSVSTVSASNLEMRGIVNMQDAVKFLPNTRMRTTYGAYQQFQVRGFDYTPIMVDGIRDERTSISNSAPIGDLSAIESIELLKGPASVLYGHSTVGGVINITRKAPTDRNTVHALLSYGSWDNKRAMIDFGGKLIGTFNYRAVVNWSDTEGYRYTNDKRFSGYFALGAKFDEQQELDIRGGFNRDWYGTEIGLPRFMANDVYQADGTKYLLKGEMLPGLNPRWRYNNESDFMINNGSNLSVRYSNNFSKKFKLENRLAYNYDNIDYFSTEVLTYAESSSPIYNHYYLNARGNKQYIQLDSVRLSLPLRFAYTVHVINEQLEASGKFHFDNGMKYNYLAGYNFVAFFRDRYRGNQLSDKYDNDGHLIQTADVYGPGRENISIPSYNPVSMGTVRTKFSDAVVNRTFTHSLYLQNLLELSDQFKVMLSGRFDYFGYWHATAGIEDGKRKYIDRTSFQKTNNSAFTYRTGVVYLPMPSLSIYGSFATYFSPYRDMYSETTVYINADGNRFYPKNGEEIFKPQAGYQGEIGTRYTFNSLFQATASAFYIKKENEKKTLKSGYVDSDGVSKSVIGQVATSDAKGFELEFIFTPHSNATLSLGYGYTDAKVRDFSFSAEKLTEEGYMDANVDIQDGVRLAGIPKNTFFAAGNYTIEKGLFKNLAFNATVSYMDNVPRDLSKTVIYPAYWQTDLGVSYKLDNGVRLRVNVNNLFDDRHFIQSLGTQITPRTPRDYLFTLAYSL